MNLCLSMIVKNEAHIIERVLTSVLPVVRGEAVRTNTTRL